MSDPARTGDELTAALGHIGYEMWMMCEGAHRASVASLDDGALRNAWLEIYVIHARALVEFFTRDVRQRSDDICLSDFGEVDWTLSERDRALLDAEMSVPCNKRIAHLTWVRAETNVVWFFRAAPVLLDAGESWWHAVESKRNDLIWWMFDNNLHDARRLLAETSSAFLY